MSTTTRPPEAEQLTVSTPSLSLSLVGQKTIAAIAIVVGIGSVLGGIGGAAYTCQQAAVQDITTPGDARIAQAPVRGPLTMWAQSDIITHHQLDSTGGLYYSQMQRMVPASAWWWW